jgi:hypothetical protein
VAARAQQPGGLRRIGMLMNGIATDSENQSHVATFRQQLRQLGWAEGQNLRIDVRWSAGDAGLSRTYAAQLIELMPDVILAATTINLTVIQQATDTVPVVFVRVSDPVAQGFVASVKQPGSNITGFSEYEFSIGGKWLDLLKAAAPGLARVAVMFNPNTSPQSKFFMQAIEAAAPSLGMVPMVALSRAYICQRWKRQSQPIRAGTYARLGTRRASCVRTMDQCSPSPRPARSASKTMIRDFQLRNVIPNPASVQRQLQKPPQSWFGTDFSWRKT